MRRARVLLAASIGALLALVPSIPAGASRAAELKPAPPIELRTPDGQPLRLTDFKGKVLLVDFFASWCGPCKASFPEIDALYREMRGQGLEVLAVNVDERRRDADDFLAAHPHEMPVALDPRGKAPAAFDVQGMPSSYLIDRRGYIRFRHMGYTPAVAAAYRREIAELLAEPGGPGADSTSEK